MQVVMSERRIRVKEVKFDTERAGQSSASLVAWSCPNRQESLVLEREAVGRVAVPEQRRKSEPGHVLRVDASRSFS
jgi:hypothetical protein